MQDELGAVMGRYLSTTEAWWHRFKQAEERELANRQNGSLRKLLGAPLPDESPQEIKRIAEEDRLRALDGFVEVLGGDGEITYKHIDELTPEDSSWRIRAEGKRLEWISGRKRRRPLYPNSRVPDEQASS